MSWTCIWHLEKKDTDGIWHLILGSFLPPSVIHHYPDADGLTSYQYRDCFDNIEFEINLLAKEGFPKDASSSLSCLADKQFEYSESELETPPRFRYLTVRDIVEADWSGSTLNPKVVCSEIWNAWLRKLESLGRPEELRIVLEWTR